MKLEANSDHVQAINSTIRVFMALETHPFSAVENNWLSSLLEPLYSILETRAVYEHHTSDRLSQKPQEVVVRWNFFRPNATIPVMTKNIVNAAEVASFICHVL